MEGFDGYRGCYLLHREEGDQVHIQVLSLWDTLASIRGFAGTEGLTAVVSPTVAGLMSAYDTEVRHDTVVIDTATGHGTKPATRGQGDGS
ncbi:hypothetical protein ACFVWY_27150 [Streptomyces sp. NPDC058195]|uniref:hypothetical protein n=1 Tax=Streptomyces sp. NPDC058195 TaxID=3346375 RepID=UPI0036E3F597